MLESDDRHERRTAIIAGELARYKIDIAALKGHFTHMKLFFKITEIETLINITYIVRFLRSTDVSVFYY